MFKRTYKKTSRISIFYFQHTKNITGYSTLRTIFSTHRCFITHTQKMCTHDSNSHCILKIQKIFHVAFPDTQNCELCRRRWRWRQSILNRCCVVVLLSVRARLSHRISSFLCVFYLVRCCRAAIIQQTRTLSSSSQNSKARTQHRRVRTRKVWRMTITLQNGDSNSSRCNLFYMLLLMIRFHVLSFAWLTLLWFPYTFFLFMCIPHAH